MVLRERNKGHCTAVCNLTASAALQEICRQRTRIFAEDKFDKCSFSARDTSELFHQKRRKSFARIFAEDKFDNFPFSARDTSELFYRKRGKSFARFFTFEKILLRKRTASSTRNTSRASGHSCPHILSRWTFAICPRLLFLNGVHRATKTVDRRLMNYAIVRILPRSQSFRLNDLIINHTSCEMHWSNQSTDFVETCPPINEIPWDDPS